MRGAIVMGLLWAVVWMPVGLLIGAIVDRDGSMDEPWIMVGTLPGFFCGVLFSVVLGIIERRRRVTDLSVSRVGAWGAAAGLLLSLFFSLSGDLNPALPGWFLPVVVGSLTLLSSGSAAGTLALARRAEQRESLGAGKARAENRLSS